MSLPRRIRERKEKDAELERELRIRKNDPSADQFGGYVYTSADIELLEEEMVPWLKAKRRREREAS